MNLKYLGGSLLCGAGWGLIAMAMGLPFKDDRSFLTGVYLSPLIGLLVGIISSPAYSLPLIARYFIPPVLVYVGAFLFAIAISIGEPSPDRMVEKLGALMYGTTIYLPMLLPFAYLTHFGLGRVRSRPAKAD